MPISVPLDCNYKTIKTTDWHWFCKSCKVVSERKNKRCKSCGSSDNLVSRRIQFILIIPNNRIEFWKYKICKIYQGIKKKEPYNVTKINHGTSSLDVFGKI